MAGTLAKDGLDIDGIIFKMYGVIIPPKPELPKDYREWTDRQTQLNEDWAELQWDKLQVIEEGWGW
jgi:hypothetical protein